MNTWPWVVIFAFMGLGLIAFELVLVGSLSWCGFGILGLAALWPLAYSTLLNWQMRGMVKRIYSEGSSRGLIGDHEMELQEDGLVDRTYYGEQKTYWRGIDRCVTVDGYIFIYLTNVSAHVIPTASITEGDWPAFVHALKAHLAKAPPSAPP